MSTVTTIAVPALVVLWLVGAVAWWSVTGLNSARFRRLIRSARPAPPELRQQLERMVHRLGLLSVPAAYILPARVVDGLQSDEWVVISHLHRIREGEKVLSERVPPPAETFRRDQGSR